METEKVAQQHRLQNELHQTHPRIKPTTSTDHIGPDIGIHHIRLVRRIIRYRRREHRCIGPGKQAIRTEFRLSGRCQQSDAPRSRLRHSDLRDRCNRALYDVHLDEVRLPTETSIFLHDFRNDIYCRLHNTGLLCIIRQDRFPLEKIDKQSPSFTSKDGQEWPGLNR